MHLSPFYSPILLSFNPPLFSVSLFHFHIPSYLLLYPSPFPLRLPSAYPALFSHSHPFRPSRKKQDKRTYKTRNHHPQSEKRGKEEANDRNLNLPRRTTNFQSHRIRDNILRRLAQHTTTTTTITAGKVEGGNATKRTMTMDKWTKKQR